MLALFCNNYREMFPVNLGVCIGNTNEHFLIDVLDKNVKGAHCHTSARPEGIVNAPKQDCLCLPVNMDKTIEQDFQKHISGTNGDQVYCYIMTSITMDTHNNNR